MSTIAFVRGSIKFPWNDSRTDANATKSVSACDISPITLSSHVDGLSCSLVLSLTKAWCAALPTKFPSLSCNPVLLSLILLFSILPDSTFFGLFSTITGSLIISAVFLVGAGKLLGVEPDLPYPVKGLN